MDKSSHDNIVRLSTLYWQQYGMQSCNFACVGHNCYTCKIRAFRKVSKSHLEIDITVYICHFFLLVCDIHVCIPQYLTLLAHPRINWSFSQLDYLYPKLMVTWNFKWGGEISLKKQIKLNKNFIDYYLRRREQLPNLYLDFPSGPK